MSSSHSPLQEKLETFTELYKNRKEIELTQQISTVVQNLHGQR